MCAVGLIFYVAIISGVPERVDYAPLSGVQTLFPYAQLKLCDVPCTINRVYSRLTLSTSHIGKGCDRDTYSVQSQRKICGKSLNTLSLARYTSFILIILYLFFRRDSSLILYGVQSSVCIRSRVASRSNFVALNLRTSTLIL